MPRTPFTCIALLLALAVAGACAGSIVENGDFTERMPDNEHLPAAWSVPPDSPWQCTNAGGHSGQHSLRYSTRAKVAADPVTQTITLPANARMVLSCAIKTDGGLKPVIRLRSPGEGDVEIARILGDGAPDQWQQYAVEFNTGDGGDAVIELWTDIQRIQRPDRPGGAGTIAIDDVQVITPDEATTAAGTEAIRYENIARGMRYSLYPPPGYPHCTDSGDRTQVTDGQYTVGYFWTQKSTVGWSRVRDISITIDLGEDHPIRGVSFNTAAGVAGVHWPKSIRVLVSTDGRAYHLLGDLVELSARKSTPPTDYAVHRFYTDELQAHGRYVKLEIVPVGNCCFVDEIEVHRGEDAWLQAGLPGEAINYPPEYYEENVFDAAWKRRIGMDLETVRTRVEQAELAPDLRQRLTTELADIDIETRVLPGIDPSTFRSTFPYNDVHARVYAVQADLWMAQGRQPIVVWRANPWEHIAPTELPDPAPPADLSIAAMKGETRAGAINLTNCTEEALDVSLAFSNLADASTPSCMTVHQVEWTDTREGLAVAAALPVIDSVEGAYSISLPAGITRQVWFSFTPTDLAPGLHEGLLTITGAANDSIEVPVALRVFDIDFPEQPRLHVGGWDYTNGMLHGVTVQNREALIEHLQERHVDSPWATSDSMGYGEFDDTGQLTADPPTSNFDAWTARWPQARNYCIFKRVGDNIAGTKIGEPLFARKVAAWVKFWVAHARTLGIEPRQLHLLLVDEPGSREEDEIIIAWANAIKAAEPDVTIFDDGTRPPDRVTPDLLSAVDVFCPHRPALLNPQMPELRASVRQQVATGNRLYFYSCFGPARLLDPYAYHRLQAWTAFQYGGEGSFFWAFGSNGGGNSWNEYATSATAYTPLFLSPDSVTAGKHMEAIRQSVADFEYLSMMRDRVAELKADAPNHPLLPEARVLLSDAVSRVLTAPGTTDLKWEDEKDSTIADTVCIEIAEMLERLN